MRKNFNAGAKISCLTAAKEACGAAEQSLISLGIRYEKDADGFLHVPGDIDISCKKLIELPDLSAVTVAGKFLCCNNQLTSLKGAPRAVGGSFDCGNNQLTSLEHAPRSVGGDFYCSLNQLTSLEHLPETSGGIWCDDNQLTSLKHAPQAVDRKFCCSNNQLTSLEYAPVTVTGQFDCSCNQLTSLRHAPTTVTDFFDCSGNQLISLEDAPREFKSLISDFGSFNSWNEVPEKLRLSPETRERLIQEAVLNTTELQAPIKIGAAFRFKSKPQKAGN